MNASNNQQLRDQVLAGAAKLGYRPAPTMGGNAYSESQVAWEAAVQRASPAELRDLAWQVEEAQARQSRVTQSDVPQADGNSRDLVAELYEAEAAERREAEIRRRSPEAHQERVEALLIEIRDALVARKQ